MWLKNCEKIIICVNGRCFDNALAAGRYVIELSSRGEAVTITRRVDLSTCLIPGSEPDLPSP